MNTAGSNLKVTSGGIVVGFTNCFIAGTPTGWSFFVRETVCEFVPPKEDKEKSKNKQRWAASFSIAKRIEKLDRERSERGSQSRFSHGKTLDNNS